MRPRNLFVILGGTVLTFVVVLLSLQAATSTAPTLIAARPIAAGTRLTAADLTTQPIHTNSRLTHALDKPELALGKVILIARASGDQITSELVSEQAGVGIPAHLDPDTVAIGIHVNQASGLGGAIREGDRVTVIAIVDPQSITTLNQLSVVRPVATPGGGSAIEVTPEPTPKPRSAAARLTITGLKVLLVPQSFRYEEVAQDKTGDLSPVRSSTGSQQSSVILLQAPLQPIEVAPGVMMSPAELLALLDEQATLHLALEPRDGLTAPATNSIGVQLADVYALLTNDLSAAPTVLPTAPISLTQPITK